MDISLHQVQVQYAGQTKPLLHISDYKIPFGKKILIHGKSGSGKTTLLHLLAGLFSPNQGQIYIGDKRISHISDSEKCEFRKKNLGLVFQRLNLLDQLTALENVELSLSPGKSGVALKALEKVNVGDKANQRASTLSLGEQQRVAVARVIANEPSIILADEPTSSLDHANADKIMQTLIETASSKTLIVVSHDERIHSFFSGKNADKLNFGDLNQ